MSITHTVLFQFKPGSKPEDIQTAIDGFFALKTNCVHPTSKAPYMVSLKGGKDNSPEGLQHELTHGFVAEFASAEDRNYYVKEDPAHQDFLKLVIPFLVKVIVVDFTDGEF